MNRCRETCRGGCITLHGHFIASSLFSVWGREDGEVPGGYTGSSGSREDPLQDGDAIAEPRQQVKSVEESAVQCRSP